MQAKPQEPEQVKVLPKPILKKPPLAPVKTAPPKSEANQAKPPPPTTTTTIRRAILPTSYDCRKKQPKRRSYCRFVCSFLIAALLIVLVCATVAGGLFYLWFTPKLPVFKLRPVHFSRFAVTAGPDGASYVDAGASVWLEVKNPNEKLEFYYGGAQAVVTADGDVELGSASLAEFTQRRASVTALRFVTRTGANLAVDTGTGRRLNETVKTGAVKLTVEVKTKVGVALGKWRLGVMVPVDVACGGVSLKKLRDGGPPNCHISWFTW